MLVILHVVAGSLSLIAGFTSLFCKKGSSLHKKSGLIFFIGMSLMAISGAVLAWSKLEHLNALAALLTLYLVSSGYLAFRFNAQTMKVFLISGLTTGLYGLYIGWAGLNSETQKIDGQPAAVAIVFGLVTVFGASMDFRRLLFKTISRRQVTIRHLWRMLVALFIATASFFLGQAQVFSESFSPLLLATPVILVLFALFYWLVRASFFKRYY